MPPIVTNGRALPGTSVNFSNNIIEIGMGNKLLVDIGIVNTIVMGGWNRLLACTSTVIQIGTKIDVTLANSVSVFEGDSWMYSGSNNTTYDIASRWGVWINLFSGGTSYTERQSRWTEEKQSKMIRFAAITGFLATIAVSLVGIQYPPFKMTVKPAEDPDNITGTNPDTGEIYYGDEELQSVELNPGGIPVILFESLFILALFVGQWILAKKMADNLKDFNGVANLSLAANGLTSAVFSEPDNQPKLVPSTFPTNIWGEDLYTHQVPNHVPTKQTAAAIFNMLPGMPLKTNLKDYLDNVGEAKTEHDGLYKNFCNIKKGLYPPHDKKPVITLSAQLQQSKKVHSSIDIEPKSIIITSSRRLESNSASYDVMNAPIRAASILLQNTKNASEIILDTTSQDKQGGQIIMNDKITAISRNSGDAIELSFIGKRQAVPEPTQQQLQAEDSADSSDTESISSSSDSGGGGLNNSVLLPEINSLLHLSGGRASLTTDDCENGIFIEKGFIQIVSNGQIVANFSSNGSAIMGKQIMDADGNVIKFGDDALRVKANAQFIRSRKNLSTGKSIRETLDEKIKDVKNRIEKVDYHIKFTGGFSGSLNDDVKKADGLYYEFHKRADGTQITKTKLGTFQAGWKGMLKSLWPLPWYNW